MGDRASAAVAQVEGTEALDGPSYSLEHGVALTLNLLGGAGDAVRNALHGTWLGHPLHPVLTDVPVGAWTAALALDVADVVRPGTFRAAARTSIAVGVLGAAASAVTGLADWQHTHDTARRAGLAHAALSTAALGLHAGSWVARRRGHLAGGRLASGLGYAVLQATAYVGGHLVYRHRLGVDHADRGLEPRRFTAVLAVDELVEDRPRRVDVEGTRVVLVRSGGVVHALGEECAHLGGPLAEGWVTRGCLVCPWHGSRYDLGTGAVVLGPATAPLPTFEVRVRHGQVEVRRRPPVPGASPGSVVAREQEQEDARAGH